MFNPSNLYAEKVFAEYPLEMWSLDDATDYVGLLNNTKRDITTWTVNKTGIGTTAVSVSEEVDFSGEICPIEDVSIYKISTSPASVFTSATIKFTSDTTFFTSSEKEFCISVPILANPYTESIRIGYVVEGSTTWSDPIKTQGLVWTVASATFSNVAALPDVATIVFEISFDYSGNPGSTYVFYVGGISAGIRAEEFVGTSLGLSGETKPTSLSLAGSGVQVSKANPYSLSDNYGYYTIDNGTSIRARNSTIPMVYGALNSTILSKANGGNPSLSIPGAGFLNESGKKFIRTLEFWMRVNVSTSEYRRIVGPVNTESTNGLYVNGPFMTLKVGDNVGSYFVGEWSRPMLVQIIIQEKSAQLKVNAETVIVLTMNTEDETLEPDTNEWIGFYAYDDVTNFEVDCIAIYPYAVPDKVAKKRFVYGQGVVLPESTNTSYGGSSVVLDYSFANYDKNHSFPKNADWTMGLTNNLYADKYRLSPAKYDLPTANFGTNTFSAWLEVMQDATQQTDVLPGRSAFYMKPASRVPGGSPSFFDLGNPYFSYDNFNILKDSPIACMYIVLKNNSAGGSTDRDTLFLVENKVTGKTFEITASNSSISYWLNGDEIGNAKIVYNTETEEPVKTIAAVDIQKFRQSNPDAFALFADTSSLQVLVGGSVTGSTFTGPIYEFGFLSQSDLNKIDQEAFDDNGFANISSVVDFENITPAYSVIGTDVIGSFSLDISSSGSWQDYVPLSIFKKELPLADGSSVKTLSMLQVNIDYPNLGVVSDGEYDTAGSPARFYVAFQNMSNGVVLSSGRTTVNMNSNDYVSPSSSWATEIYEVVDGSIVGIPDFDNLDEIAMIFYTVLDVDGVSKNPVVVRAIDVASLAFDDESLRAIGTKYGTKVYPFVETTDETYVSSANNPFLIYKGTTPYLYLSSKTGIQVVGDILSPTNENYVHRGIVANINEQKVPSYDVSSIMMSVRYQDDLFPATKLPIFEIEGHIFYNGNIENIYLRFYVESINLSNTRGKIFCEASIAGGAFAEYSDIIYYWNGNIVTNPVLSAKEWGMVSISFTNFIKFPSITGTFEILGKLLVDNVSIYKISDTTAQSSTTINSWNTALYGSADWGHVLDTDGLETPTNSSADDNTWSSTYLVIKTSQKPVDQTEIYRSYLGTNKIIVDTSDSNSTLKPQKCEYIIYNAVEWKTNTLNAL